MNAIRAFLRSSMTPEDWKRGIALVILWAYGYQLVVWPLWFSVSTYLTWAFFQANPLPAPVIVPWEQLVAGTGTLAAVGGIQAWREGKNGHEEVPQQ